MRAAESAAGCSRTRPSTKDLALGCEAGKLWRALMESLFDVRDDNWRISLAAALRPPAANVSDSS
jgi:hypothetical protein